MTANAFVEDRADCMAAGMNDHVAKPVEPALLYAMALHWLPLSRSAPHLPLQAVRTVGPTAASDAMVQRLEAVAGFDGALALRQVGGQPELLARVLSRFAETYRDGLPELLDLSGNDEQRRERWAAACHAVKGALATVGATEAERRVLQLEQALDADASQAVLAASAQALHATLLNFVAQLAALGDAAAGSSRP